MAEEQHPFDPENPENPLHLMTKHAPDTPVAPAHGIAAIALGMALRYHDINTVQDGVLYQQYKMEGRNMRELQLNHVFETAIRMERHLLESSQRLAAVVIDAVKDALFEPEEDETVSEPSTDGQETVSEGSAEGSGNDE